MMKYKGYFGSVQYDDEAKIFHGEIIDTRAVITFQGTSLDEIEQTFRDKVDDYLDWCKERGKEPDGKKGGQSSRAFPAVPLEAKRQKNKVDRIKKIVYNISGQVK